MRPTAQRTRLLVDLGLYGVSAAFALWTAYASNLLPHRAWGSVAWLGYAAAFVLTLVILFAPSFGVAPSFGETGRVRGSDRPVSPKQGEESISASIPAGGVVNGGRALVAGLAFLATALLPLVIQAVQRAGGRTDRAQEEVIVIEEGARRLLDTGSPYLDRASLAVLDQPLLAYNPYQPGMSVFGIPRALADGWWTDARIWFALATIGALAAALHLLFWAGASRPALIRATQFATAVPVCALTLATGGDDLPVLAFCLLALACLATGRFGLGGLAVGTAAALKLFAWPIVIVLAVHALTQGRRPTIRYLAGALGIPAVTALPVLIGDSAGFVENVLRFPLGQGVVTSPARSPLPGYLIAENLPGGRWIALGLLAAAGLAIAVLLVRRPPRTAVAAALLCGYGLGAAMLLLPSTRFGYLLYPLALLLWAPALRAPHGFSPRET